MNLVIQILTLGIFSFVTVTVTAAAAVPATQPIPSYKNISISGQPSSQTLKNFKKTKGAVVLDLRAIDELGNCSEPATSAKLGLEYQRVNFEKTATLSREVIQSIDRVVAQAGKKPILVFCKTGSRASSWLTIHLVQTEKMSLESALKITRPMGLKPKMELAVREFLSRPSATTLE